MLGADRDGVSQHAFRGGNAFMLRMLNRYRDELQVTAPAADLERAAELTEEHLGTETAAFGSLDVRFADGAVVVDVDVRNATGHKLPTAYPSRRAWIHLTARDQTGRTIFESGAPQADGSIAGNANDEDASAFEPHYTEITAEDQVQIYLRRFELPKVSQGALLPTPIRPTGRHSGSGGSSCDHDKATPPRWLS